MFDLTFRTHLAGSGCYWVCLGIINMIILGLTSLECFLFNKYVGTFLSWRNLSRNIFRALELFLFYYEEIEYFQLILF